LPQDRHSIRSSGFGVPQKSHSRMAIVPLTALID
jgi:hypothetical protein